MTQAPRYGIHRLLPGVSYADAIARARAALAEEGFGVLTEIDVQATLRTKLGVEVPPYVILGACNPPLAHQALQADPGIGLLLPCNVVVSQTPDGAAVAAIDPHAMFSVIDVPGIAPLAAAVKAKLERALDRL
jgi:uncharacterized protein (DUF302 family)